MYIIHLLQYWKLCIIFEGFVLIRIRNSYVKQIYSPYGSLSFCAVYGIVLWGGLPSWNTQMRTSFKIFTWWRQSRRMWGWRREASRRRGKGADEGRKGTHEEASSMSGLISEHFWIEQWLRSICINIFKPRHYSTTAEVIRQENQIASMKMFFNFFDSIHYVSALFIEIYFKGWNLLKRKTIFLERDAEAH